MHHNRILLALAAGTLTVPAVQAQDELLTITVTGTRTPRPVEETLVPTTVITREEIENSAAQSVPELLQGRAGVNLINQGGRGKNTSLYLRGTSAEHVLLLVDGVRLSSATNGQPAFQHLPLEEIERIEIVRGPRSALYGSDAIGGVIQVFTRRGGQGQRAGGRVGYGTYDSREVAVWAEGGQGNSSYALSASHYKTEGFEATTPDNFSFEDDDDGYESSALSLRGGHRFGNGLEVNAHALRAQGTTEYDGGAVDSEDDFIQQVLGLNLEYPLTQSWTTRLQLAESRDESEGEDFFFDTRRLNVYWQNDLELAPDHLLTLGVDWYEDEVDSSTDFARSEAEQTGIYGQYQGGQGPHQWLAGLRWEDTDAFGSETTGNLGYGYEINPDLELTLSYGTGFRTPTFNDLFFPDVGFFRGNPDLEPETSESFEVGLQGYHDRGYWRASVFHTEIDDIIVFDPANATVDNLSEARITGLELEADARFGDWNLAGALTVQYPEDKDTGNLLPRRTRQSLRLDVSRQLARGEAGVSLIAEGSRYNEIGNSNELGGYGLVNLWGEYELSRGLSVRAQVDNLFDKDYQTVLDYNQPGTEVFVSLDYRFR